MWPGLILFKKVIQYLDLPSFKVRPLIKLSGFLIGGSTMPNYGKKKLYLIHPGPFPDSSVDDDRIRSGLDPADLEHPDQSRHRVTQPETANLGSASHGQTDVDAIQGRASQFKEPASL